MNKLFYLILIIFSLSSCSFNPNSKIWNEDRNKFESNKNLKKIIVNEKNKIAELNPSIKIDLSNIKTNIDFKKSTNNFGSLIYKGSFDKIGSFKFLKFKDLNEINFEPLFFENSIIFFDRKGSIIRYDENHKVIWKKNHYSKSEKKLSPKMSFFKEGKNIIIVDNIGKIFYLNGLDGELIWMKNNTYPFNSKIRSSQGKLFAVDYNNILRCFYIKDGSPCWKYQTDTSLTLSNSKYSIILVKDNVVFTNSLGDITSIDIADGSVNWQLPTQSNLVLNETYNFKNSELISDNKSIYFSNNQNQFYSIDIKTGVINWQNQINSDLTPIVVGKFIFTISEEGYLYTLQKDQGNIIRINDIYSFLKVKDREKIKPVGFLIGNEKIYLSNNDGKIIIIDLSSGKVMKTLKISRDQISRPFINNKFLYIIKNGFINQYN